MENSNETNDEISNVSIVLGIVAVAGCFILANVITQKVYDWYLERQTAIELLNWKKKLATQ